jgi:hypothetical protein
MQDRPSSTELLAAVREFLQREILPALHDHRQRFRTLIAANVLGVVERELSGEQGRLREEQARLIALDPHPTADPGTGRLPDGAGARGEGPRERLPDRGQESLDLLRQDVDARKRALCARIRDGDADDGPWRREVLAYARWAVEEKLRVSNPRYLERFTKKQGE